MLSKRTKKIVSRCFRSACKHRTDINNNSIMKSWHIVRDPNDSESWYRYSLLEFDCLGDAISTVDSWMQDSRSWLPGYDCSGLAFMYDYHVGLTNIPNIFAVVEYWTIDV